MNFEKPKTIDEESKTNGTVFFLVIIITQNVKKQSYYSKFCFYYLQKRFH